MARNDKKKSFKGKNRSNKNMRRDTEIMDTAKREFQADARERRDCYKSQDNDWTWYAQSPQLVKDYASYPFGTAVGSRLPASLGTNMGNGSIPGVMALYFSPQVGAPTDSNAPINIASRNIYSYVRHANSGHSNYDAPDLMLYLVAMDSVYMFHSFMKRVLGMMYNYTPENRYYPAAVVQAMGVDPTDVSNHLADFRGFINQYAVKMGSMCVPNSMSYMARHTWMTEGLYVDNPVSAKAQTYMYVPWQYYQFGYDTEGAGQLALTPFWRPLIDGSNADANGSMSKLRTVSDMINFANNLLDPIVANEDMNIMSGDILKAFGNEGVVKIAGISEGYQILPQYSQEVLSQIENCTILDGEVGSTILQNTDVGGGYLYQPSATGTSFMVTPLPMDTTTADKPTTIAASTIAGGLLDSRILNFHHMGVTPEEVMVATRLCNVYQIPEEPATYSNSILNKIVLGLNCNNIGSEVINYARIYYYIWVGNTMNLLTERFGTNYMAFYAQSTSQSPSDFMKMWAGYSDIAIRLSTFDWHPAMYSTAGVRGLGVTKPVFTTARQHQGPLMDIDNYTVIDAENLKQMTLAALLSEFSVPQMGAFAQKI